MNYLKEYLVTALASTKLFEMAYSREKYIDKVNDLSRQIVENWCLIRYCTKYDTGNTNKNHWKTELLAHCDALYQMFVKTDKKTATKTALIGNDELNTPKHIAELLQMKFNKEHLEVKDDICREFAEYGLYKIINLVSAKHGYGNYQELYRYIDKDI